MNVSARSCLYGSLLLLAACSSGLERELPTLEPLNTTTLRVPVAVASDDAEEPTGRAAQLTGPLLDLYAKDGAVQLTGLRFQNLAIPQGAKIESAYVVMKAGLSDTAAAALRVQGEASDNAATFAAVTGGLSSRAKTAAAVVWNPEAWAVGKIYQTANLAPVVQEVVSRGGWQSGNAVALFVGGSSGTGERAAMGFGNPYGGPPELIVTYSAGTATAPTAPTTPTAPAPVPAGTSVAVRVSVAATTDDAEGTTSAFLTGKALDFAQNRQAVGLRFSSVPVPKGAVVKDAAISFVASAADAAPLNLLVRGEASDSAAPFSGPFGARPQTAASALWQPKPWTVGLATRTSDLSRVLQEIVSRGGWANGNAVTFYVTGDSAATGAVKRSAYSRDAGAAYAAVLRVTYELPTTPTPTPVPTPTPTPTPVPTPTPTPTPVPTPTPTPVPTASCLEGTAPLMSLTGDYPATVYVRQKTQGVRVDARNARFLAPAGQASFATNLNAGSFCLYGGLLDVAGLTDTTDWNTFHSAHGLLFYGTPNAVIENLTTLEVGDGIAFKNDNPNWTFRNSYIRHAGDDGIENDRFNAGTVDNVLIDWAYTGVSCRQESVAARNVPFRIQNTLIALRPQRGSYSGKNPGHGELFKVTKNSTRGCKLILRDNVFLITNSAGYVDPSDDPLVRYDMLDTAACAGHKNTIVYVGRDAYYLARLRAADPACFTVTTDVGVWKAARSRWFDRNPQFRAFRYAEPSGYR